MGHVRRALAEADPGFVHGCLANGLSSGEGLIAQVRDAVDDGDADAPADKRRLVLEQEFAQVLKVLSREGNTLSPIVRQAWDGDALQTMVRNNPLRARLLGDDRARAPRGWARGLALQRRLRGLDLRRQPRRPDR